MSSRGFEDKARLANPKGLPRAGGGWVGGLVNPTGHLTPSQNEMVLGRGGEDPN